MRRIHISKQNRLLSKLYKLFFAILLINIVFATNTYASMINSVQPQGPGEAVVPNLPLSEDNLFNIYDNHDFDNTNVIQRDPNEDQEHYNRRNSILGGNDADIINIALESGGNNTRLIELMKKAKVGGEYTIACYGGSITYGALLGHNSERFGDIVYSWFCSTFPKAKFNYVSSGLGASNTEMGCYRIERDLLQYKPDFVIVDFAVNTSNVDDIHSTYSTILYKILNSAKKPAVCAINFTYSLKMIDGSYVPAQGIPDSGLLRAQTEFNIPTINYHKYVWTKIMNGEIYWPDFNADYIHPNKYGHNIAASLIKAYLQCLIPENGIEVTSIPDGNYSYFVADSKFMNVGYMTNENAEIKNNEYLKKCSNIDCYNRGWQYVEGGEGELEFTVPNQKRVGLTILFTPNAKGYLDVESLDVGGHTYINSEVSDVLKLFYINLAGEKFKLTTKLTQGSFKIFGICINYEDG